MPYNLDNAVNDEDVIYFKSGEMPLPFRDIVIFYDDNSGLNRLNSTYAWTNDNGDILTVSPLLFDAVAWGYKENFDIPNKVEDFVKISLCEFDDDEDLEMGIFRSVPSYDQFSKFLKDELPDATILSFSEMTPKLTVFNIDDVYSNITAVYADFTISYKNIKYDGIIENFEIGEWN